MKGRVNPSHYYVIKVRSKNSRIFHFMPLVSFYAPWKHQKKEVFSDIFRGYRKRPVARNGLSCSVLCCIYFKLKVKTPNKNSHKRCSVKKDVLKNFAKFTGKHLCQSLVLIKLQATLITLTSFYRTPLDDYFWPKWLQLFSNSEHVFTCSEVHQMLPEGTIN